MNGMVIFKIIKGTIVVAEGIGYVLGISQSFIVGWMNYERDIGFKSMTLDHVE